MDLRIVEAIDNKSATFVYINDETGSRPLTHTEKLIKAKEDAKELLTKYLVLRDKYFHLEPIFKDYDKQLNLLEKIRRDEWISLACWTSGAIAIASLPQIAQCTLKIAKIAMAPLYLMANLAMAWRTPLLISMGTLAGIFIGRTFQLSVKQ